MDKNHIIKKNESNLRNFGAQSRVQSIMVGSDGDRKFKVQVTLYPEVLVTLYPQLGRQVGSCRGWEM